LPDPISIRAASDDVALPQTDTEKVVAAIFSDLLCFEPVGAEDDFFEIGGHSLLATRLLSRLRAAFQVEFSLRSVFENPTVRGLGTAIDAKLNRQATT
jgi:acyl carrier protein